jgi:phosphoglycolate phosphatase-like HAD superfamily hydrolase
MRILLFDIDGTLIRSGGAGKVALHEALRSHFGVHDVIDRVNFAGRTDPGIGVDLLRLHQLEPSAENLQKLEAAYLGHLPGALQTHQGEVLPGVVRWLDRFREAGRPLGLLTGNIRRGAEIKLRHFGLWDYFNFGGFGDGHHDRDDVARHCVQETRKHFNQGLEEAEWWVIGDTPLDVKCARAIGARCVGVLTGWHTREEMLASGVDYLFDHLEQADELFAGWV